MNRSGQLLLALCLLAGTVRAQDVANMPELAARTATMRAASDLYRSGQLDEIDTRMRQYVRDSARTPSGLWISGVFSLGLEQAVLQPQPKTPDQWEALDSRTLEWATTHPESPLARLTHAEVIQAHAWRIRGGGYASTVPETAWAPFRAELRRAEAYLLKEKQVAAEVPEYYPLMLSIANGLDKPQGEIDALLAECERRFPAYYPAYFSVLVYLLPKWHGDESEIARFVQESVQRTRGREGDSMYARIYWYAVQQDCEKCEDSLPFAMRQWALMKRGFQDIVKRYPDQWNYQNYAHFACLARDTKTLGRLLFDHVRPPVIAEAWSGDAGFEACEQLAGRVKL